MTTKKHDDEPRQHPKPAEPKPETTEAPKPDPMGQPPDSPPAMPPHPAAPPEEDK